MDDAASTITEYIDSESELELSFKKTFFKEVDSVDDTSNLILLSSSIIEKYYDEIMSTVTYSKTLTPEERRKYYYNPQYLSYDLYETTHLWHLLLEANEMSSITEFCIPTIKVFDSTILEVLQGIISEQQELIDINEDEITESLS